MATQIFFFFINFMQKMNKMLYYHEKWEVSKISSHGHYSPEGIPNQHICGPRDKHISRVRLMAVLPQVAVLPWFTIDLF